MPLTNVDLFRIDGSIGSVINIQTAALNNGPLAGTRNRIINGDMRIDQRNAGASVTAVTPNVVFSLDRWPLECSVTSKYTAQRSTVAPAGFTNSLLATSTSAYSVAAGDFFMLRQNIEGFNTADLGWGAAGALSVTLSFWVRSSLTGSFSGSLRNASDTRSYVFSYTINAANTWEYKTITIPGDTTGTWLTDNSKGISIQLSLGAGSTYSTTAGAWSAGNYVAATGSTSVVGTNGATFYLTGVQLEPGTVATPFERRSYGQELALCQRYYEKSYNFDVAPGTVTSIGAISYRVSNSDCLYSFRLKTEKRATADYGIFNPATGSSTSVRNLDSSVNYTPTVSYASASGATITMSGVSSAHIQFHYTASAEL